MIKPEKVFFIKLGSKGDWEEECVDIENTIKLGFHNPLHDECLKGNWDKVNHYWRTTGQKTLGKATETTNQIKTFYETNEKTLWITFYKRKLYWCFVKPEVTILKDRSRIRNVKGKWSCKDINGDELFVENLRGSLTKVQGFRGTICSVSEADYLVNRINCVTSSDVTEFLNKLNALKKSMIPLIKGLNWKDFELLTDMIFLTAGWQRISTRGKTEKSIDLTLLSPLNNKKAFVQVKSKSSFNEYQKYLNDFKNMDQFNELYYVVHSADEKLISAEAPSNVNIITIQSIADLVVDSGLVNWLVDKTK